MCAVQFSAGLIIAVSQFSASKKVNAFLPAMKLGNVTLGKGVDGGVEEIR